MKYFVFGLCAGLAWWLARQIVWTKKNDLTRVDRLRVLLPKKKTC